MIKATAHVYRYAVCALTVQSVLFVIFKLKSDANSSSDRHTVLQSIICEESEKHL